MAAAILRNPRSRLLRPLFAALSSTSASTAETSATATVGPGASKALRSAILSEPDPDRLTTLFQTTAVATNFQFCPDLYALAVKKLLRSRRLDLIDPLLSHSLSHPSSPHSDRFLALIITLYSDANMLHNAILAFTTAVSSNRPVAERSLCALLLAYLKAGKYSAAIESFSTIPKQLNLTPTVYSHNVMLQVLCKMGDFTAACQMLDEMSNSDSAKPDIVSYTRMLNGYLSIGDEAGFDEILKKIDDEGLVGNVFIYNIRIKALCLKKEMLKAEELLEEMVAKNVAVSRASFKPLLLGLIKGGCTVSALRVFQRMKGLSRRRKEVAPDNETYNILIRGLVKKEEFGEALEVCKDCLARKIVPDFQLVKGLAEGLAKISKVEEAKDVVERMRVVVNKSVVNTWKKIESEINFSGAVVTEENLKTVAL